MTQKNHLNPELMAALGRLVHADIPDKLTTKVQVQAAIEHIEAIEKRLLDTEAKLVAFKSVVILIQESCHHIVTEPFFDDITKMSGKICVNCQKIITKGDMSYEPNSSH